MMEAKKLSMEQLNQISAGKGRGRVSIVKPIVKKIAEVVVETSNEINDYFDKITHRKPINNSRFTL